MTWKTQRPLSRLFFSVLFLVFLWNFQAQSENLTFVGIRPEDREKIQKIFASTLPPLSPKISFETVDEIIRYLVSLGLYDQVSAHLMNQDQIQIQATPIVYIQQITFSGNSHFQAQRLLEVLGLRAGEPYKRKRAQEAGERLKNFYGDEGFFDAQVEVHLQSDKNNNMNLQFVVEEKKPCLISGLDIESANAELNDRLHLLTDRVLKKPLTLHTVQRLRQKIESFLQAHHFLRAELIGPEPRYNSQKTQAHLTFKITEPFRYDFDVEGLDKMSRTEMYQYVNFDAFERGHADPATQLTERLRNTYLSLGFPNVELQVQTKEFPSLFLRRLYVHIKEHEKVHIKEIFVGGRVSRPSSYYENFIRQNSSDLIYRGYFSRQGLDIGFDNLINDLHNKGYLHAKIQSSRLEYLDEPDTARVVVLLDEGPLTQISGITFKGLVAFTPQKLLSVLSVKPNTPLSLTDLEKSIGDLKLFYRNQGYLEMKLLNEGVELVQYNEKETQGHILFDIYEGPQVFVGYIHLEGNSFTKSDVILRTLDLKIGEVLTPEKLEEAEVRLNRLGIFSRVNLRTLEEGTNVSQRHLIVAVTERDPGVFRLGTGVNSERDLTLRGFMGLSYNNLGGTARGLSGRAEVKSHLIKANYPQYEVIAGYLEPFLFESRTRGRVNLTRSERIFDLDTKNNRVNITASNKIDFYLERDLSRHTRLTWKLWSLDSRREFELHGHCINDPSQLCSASVQQIATLGPTLDVDYRDNPFLPTKGHYTTWNLDYSDPVFGSTDKINFVRTEAGYSQYTRIKNTPIVWANSWRGGYVSNLSSKSGSGVPTSHAFFLGGLSSIRGFGGSQDNERLPPGWEFPVQQGNQLIVPQDSHYFLIKSEFRFPIFGDHGGVIFYDGGLVQVTGFHFSRPYRDAVGVGYRYNTPVGPLSIDIGFKINPNTSQDHVEAPFRVHFSFGTF